jgi:hypothetical protein
VENAAGWITGRTWAAPDRRSFRVGLRAVVMRYGVSADSRGARQDEATAGDNVSTIRDSATSDGAGSPGGTQIGSGDILPGRRVRSRYLSCSAGVLAGHDRIGTSDVAYSCYLLPCPRIS